VEEEIVRILRGGGGRNRQNIKVQEEALKNCLSYFSALLCSLAKKKYLGWV